MSEKDGGKAFPVMREDTVYRDGKEERVYYHDGGMSLRDYFAGQALTGMAANWSNPNIGGNMDDYVSDAYRIADAMLAERSK